MLNMMFAAVAMTRMLAATSFCHPGVD